jgi:hypothetical protein
LRGSRSIRNINGAKNPNLDAREEKLMGGDELQELHEHAEHAKHDPSMTPISLTMAVLAVVVAGVSLLGHRSHTEEVVLQDKASDQWAFYQAKNIRRHTDELFADLTSVVAAKDAAQAAQLHDKYLAEATRYRDEQKDLDAEARKLEQETEQAGKRADRYDLGEVFLEIALVVTSITLLSGRRAFWHAGIVLGLVGVVVAATGLLLH